jgi:hypothetical protein
LLQLLGDAVCVSLAQVDKTLIQIPLLISFHHGIQKVLDDGYPALAGMVGDLHFYT